MDKRITIPRALMPPASFQGLLIRLIIPICKVYLNKPSKSFMLLYTFVSGINVFGFFWLAFFVSALGQMVLAQVFAQWYWTVKKSTLPFFAITAAFYRTIRYTYSTMTTNRSIK